MDQRLDRGDHRGRPAGLRAGASGTDPAVHHQRVSDRFFNEIIKELPSEHQLIQMYDCSRNTVRRAIAELAERICTGTMLIGNYGSDEAWQEQGMEGMLRPYEAAAVRN